MSDLREAAEYERRIRTKIYDSNILTNGEWVYLVGVFQAANEHEECAALAQPEAVEPKDECELCMRERVENCGCGPDGERMRRALEDARALIEFSSHGPNYSDPAAVWQDDKFVLYGMDGFWPNLHKREHVIFRPLPADAILALQTRAGG